MFHSSQCLMGKSADKRAFCKFNLKVRVLLTTEQIYGKKQYPCSNYLYEIPQHSKILEKVLVCMSQGLAGHLEER